MDAIKQVAYVDTEETGELKDLQERWIDLASLDPADVRSMYSNPQGELVLGIAGPDAISTKIVAKLVKRLLVAG